MKPLPEIIGGRAETRLRATANARSGRRSRLKPLLPLLFAWTAAIAAPPPEEFALRVPLQTPGAATWYRFGLPLTLQMQAHEADLRDLRVFNGAGEAVPYSMTAATASRQEA